MEKISKIITLILWALVIVSVILVVSLMVNINNANNSDPDMLSWINTNLIWVYILGIAGASLTVFFGLVQTLTSLESAKKGLISVGFLGGVVLIAYILASPEIPKFLGADKFIAEGLNGQTMKLVDTGLIALYFMLGIALMTLILGPIVTRLIRK